MHHENLSHYEGKNEDARNVSLVKIWLCMHSGWPLPCTPKCKAPYGCKSKKGNKGGHHPKREGLGTLRERRACTMKFCHYEGVNLCTWGMVMHASG